MPSLDHELWQLGQKSIHQHTAAVHREISSVSEKVNSVRERNRILNEEVCTYSTFVVVLMDQCTYAYG